MNCTKTAYRSRGAAEAHLRSLLTRGGDIKDSTTLCTYLHTGHGWHVGHRSDLGAKSVEVLVPLIFDGEYLWLGSGEDRLRVGKRRATGDWSFYTMGLAHGKLLNRVVD